MLGAIIGDIIGSPYEFDDRNIKTTDFPLFTSISQYTDDTVMTLAVGYGLKNGKGDQHASFLEVRDSMQALARVYPNAGYGGRFRQWISSEDPQPYYSYGNGSAMRVSSVAWLYDTLEEVEDFARVSAQVTHNHPEGIKGAQATAAAIFLSRKGTDKKDIKKYIEKKYGYNLSRSCKDIRPYYHHFESCQQTVPEAMTAFLEGNSFEEVIRLAVSLGGDCDTLTAIAGSIAEGCYPVPPEIEAEALCRLDTRLLGVYNDIKKDFRS